MKHICLLMLAGMLAAAGARQPQQPRVVALQASDGTALKASYFSAATRGPGVLLLHQINRDRKSWDGVARQLAAAGVNVLTLDMRAHGDSSGTPFDRLPSADQRKIAGWQNDVEAAFEFLVSQPGVNRDAIGIGGAGGLGVDKGMKAARTHASNVKSLVMLSGETLLPELQFLHEASQLPGLFVVSDDDEYPPTVEAMELLYTASSNSGKRLVHYAARSEAPWLWYEPFDIGRVPANGGHGTDLFKTHPELPGIIVDWFVTTLVKTPGHAPADTVAAAAVLNDVDQPGGVARVRQQLIDARARDPQVQLFPEISMAIKGHDQLRAGALRAAIPIYELNVLAYPDSPDSHDDLAGAYLADGRNEVARRQAEKGVALLDAGAPASSWSNTAPRRTEVRRDLEQVLQKVNAAR